MGSHEDEEGTPSSGVLEAAAAAHDLASKRMPVWVERLRVIVDQHSGSDSPEGREQVVGQLAEWAAQAGCECELVPTQAGSHLVARLPGLGSGRIVLLGHHDTVFERKTCEQWHFSCHDGYAYGPGVADMKGGLLVGLLAIEALAQGGRSFETVELHSVPDEESRWSPFAAFERVRGARAALVLECGRENGDVVVARKTGAVLRFEVQGRPAHAGTDVGRGRDAIMGLCKEVLRWQALNERRPGLSVVACTIAGGTRVSVVAERAEAGIDVRALSSSDLDWALEQIAASQTHPDLRMTVDVLERNPPMESTPKSEAMLTLAARIASSLGTPLRGMTSGGMSDASFTASAGIPSLDGLGPVGGKDHSTSEYIRLDSVPVRCAVVAGLCEAVGGGLFD